MKHQSPGLLNFLMQSYPDDRTRGTAYKIFRGL